MPMNIVICAKEVLDPDAVDNYALAGKLEVEADGKTLVRKSIPRLMNAYDEQAIECALRLRDAGADCKIHVVSLGTAPTKILQHSVAMGADEVAMIPVDTASVDGHATASLLAAFIKSIGGADLVLCGRQASDVDQGVVPSMIAEMLGMPVVTVAREVELIDGPALRVTRVTPDGDEIVEVGCPAVVTISNELGDPRYPTGIRTVKAQRVKPRQVSPDELGVDEGGKPRWTMTRQSVEQITGSCEFIDGDSAAAKARALVERLRADGVIE
ncbi:MAG: electron transfer flavoprotein subunit beta/FixA family protein [Deltaproteobacteria bacterium]|nr:MAG: electron transfer flavoprotein subunit beta/FixA family protein [Deltaproteobacteria bacterium]